MRFEANRLRPAATEKLENSTLEPTANDEQSWALHPVILANKRWITRQRRQFFGKRGQTG